MPRAITTAALLLASAMALSPLAAQAGEPWRAQAQADDAYAYQRGGSGGEAYSYRREVTESGGEAVRGEVNCQGYCLPPGYRIEDPAEAAPPYDDQGDGYVGEPAYQDDQAYVAEPGYREEPGGYVGEPVYRDEPVRTGGEFYAEREDRYGARRTSYEERGGYSWGYEERGGWDRRDEQYDGWGGQRCRQRYDARGRLLDSCGEVRLSDSFFWGGGGVGPEYIDGGSGGGGGGYAEASAGAGAYASARASVGVSIRIGGRGGHKGGGHKGGGGCGKCGGH
ncbi:MAG: hypothetical protein EON95_01560 [Caulobacteraceae bacterium]|nr:MAG: hypothetical protein EON95_01560 [Caulobacteraceae bacterium]